MLHEIGVEGWTPIFTTAAHALQTGHGQSPRRERTPRAALADLSLVRLLDVPSGAVSQVALMRPLVAMGSAMVLARVSGITFNKRRYGMKRNLAHRLVVVGTALLFSAFVGLVAAGRANAQGSNTGAGNPTILQAIQNLQNSVNALQATVNTLQTTVNNQKTILTNLQNAAKPRRFYLTQGTSFDGSHALAACAAGFHMANLYEILDPSNLKYDTTLGFTRGDSGEGPPADSGDLDAGWIRTGNGATITNPARRGESNCNGWTSDSLSDTGTTVFLQSDWDSVVSGIGPWAPSADNCRATRRVWCVEN